MNPYKLRPLYDPCLFLFSKSKSFKANHLAYIEPRWYVSRISADFSKNCFSRSMILTEVLTSNFSWETEERGRHAEITCFLENGRYDWNKELISCDKSELNFEDNCTYFSWVLHFISSTIIQDELRRNQIISVKEKASLMTIPTQIKTLREEIMLQVLLLQLPLLLSLSIQIFNHKFDEHSRVIYYLTIHRILLENQSVANNEGEKQVEKLEDFSCDRLFSKPTLAYS